LEAQFNTIIEMAGEECVAPPIGVLISDNRDVWADAREAVVAASPDGRNEAFLRKVEGAMVVVALDDTMPITREEISWNTWVGAGRNRWSDKHQREHESLLSCIF
jgi:carnitine O-acetyltransferase